MRIQRTAYLDTLRQRLGESPVVALVGPSQAGKTTLARLLAASWTGLVHSFDLESPADLARLANPELALRPLQGLVILDEVQRRPDLFPLLRVLADRPEAPARFLVLGSASPDLVAAGSESLAGRVAFIDATGFSLAELGAQALAPLWWRGGFPRAYLAPSDAAARRYLDILCGTYVVRQLPPWFANLKKRQVRSPKVYIRDSGILHALLGVPDAAALQGHPKLGASWEGFCLEQLLSVCGERDACFWGTHAGAELDLLLDHLYVVHPGEHRFALDKAITASPLPMLIDELQLSTLP